VAIGNSHAVEWWVNNSLDGVHIEFNGTLTDAKKFTTTHCGGTSSIGYSAT
jgi:hypothetical protein